METFRTVLEILSAFILPVLIVGFPLYGLFKKVAVYEEFIVGAKDGFKVAVTIIPYLVAILFAIGMFRASGAMDFMINGLRPAFSWFGIPPEVLPMMIIRPLTGSGSAAIVLDMIQQFGEDSILVKMAATMFGSTETTFYVIAVYFGAVNVRKTRHAIPAGLIADGVALLLSVFVVMWLFGLTFVLSQVSVSPLPRQVAWRTFLQPFQRL